MPHILFLAHGIYLMIHSNTQLYQEALLQSRRINAVSPGERAIFSRVPAQRERQGERGNNAHYAKVSLRGDVPAQGGVAATSLC